jgi:hypothetical protein
MDDAVGVRRIQGGGDLDREAERAVVRHPTPGDAGSKRLTFDQLHHETFDLGAEAHVVQRADVGVIQARRGPRLAFEPLTPRVVWRAARQHLDGDASSQPGVDGGIHLSHAACPEQSAHLVGPEQRASWNFRGRMMT